MRLKRRGKILLIFLILFISTNITYFLVFYAFNGAPAFHDADRKENGNTIITATTFQEIFHHLDRVVSQDPVEPNSTLHKIIELNPSKEKIWEFTGLSYPHEIEELPNGHILIADTGFDRLIEVNYPNKDIIWSWEPSKINWTEVNPKWNSTHYYNNPIAYDWTHLNDVDYKDYGSWNACLISIRNFDLIVEVNYTAELLSPNDPNNIVWYYGDYGNYSIIRHQHNPDYLSDGNLILSDSENNRIIMIDYNTKELLWEYENDLNWPRDADELANGNILITDSFNGRILEVDRNTKEVVWRYWKDIVVPYESDQLPNGNILVSNGLGGVVYEINYDTKTIVWRYGFNFIRGIIYMNFILLIGLFSIVIALDIFEIYKNDLTREKKKSNLLVIAISCSVIIFSVFMMTFYNALPGWIISGIIEILTE